MLDDLGVFWRIEEDPEAKPELLQLIFEPVWLDDGRIVARKIAPAVLRIRRR